jgi:Transposase, Mutator family
VRLRVPKPSQRTFETAIIERYRRRESSVEEALIDIVVHCTATSSANAFPNGQSALNLAAARLPAHRRHRVVDKSIPEHRAAEPVPGAAQLKTANDAEAVKAVTAGMVTMIFRS